MKIELTLEDYKQCLFFALKMWYLGGKSTLDWRKAGRRDIGDYLNDHIQGKLAELAIKKFLKNTYDIECEIDLEVRPGIQTINESDLKYVIFGREKRKPRMNIDIKATSPSSKYFLVDAREFQNRKYDAYILVMVNLPKDHLIRVLADITDFPEELKAVIQPLPKIECDLIGFLYRHDIENSAKLYKAGEWLPDPNKPSRKLVQLKVDNYAIALTELRKTRQEWENLTKSL